MLNGEMEKLNVGEGEAKVEATHTPLARGESLYSRHARFNRKKTSLPATLTEGVEFENGEQQPQKSSKRLFGPIPSVQLGPNARIADTELLGISFNDPSYQDFDWQSPPENILIIKKHHETSITEHFLHIAKWIMKNTQLTVYCEKAVLEEIEVKNEAEVSSKLKILTHDSSKDINLALALGGDGTLLHIASLFQSCCPPVLGIHMGSLGFLTPFSIGRFEESLRSVLNASTGLTLRSRLKCQVRNAKYGEEKTQFECLILNEVVIDRGNSSSVAQVDIHCNGRYLTTVLGDGLIISTPTGSTAYSAAAGASMVHPSVPGIVVTPICPHSLSFRPIVLPPGIELRIYVPPTGRSKSASVSFDGRNRKEIGNDVFLRVTTSVYPVPCISHQDHLSDWFNSLAECLHWNRREMKRTKSFSKDA